MLIPSSLAGSGPRMPRPLVALLTACFTAGAAGQSVVPAEPQDSPHVLAEMSIEDLLAISLPAMTNVLGGHTHNAGEWMPMVQYMHMQMRGMRDGTSDLSTSEVLAQYPVTPRAMSTDMLMLGVMYGYSDDLTLMVMVPYLERSMDLSTSMMGGVDFSTRSQGWGDTQLSAIFVVFEDYDESVHLNLGLSAPTGSIDERDDTPMASDVRLPYPMQLGSGTWDARPAITYVHADDAWQWGGQVRCVLRLGENDNDYTLGDRFEATAWLERGLTENLGGSLRLLGLSWGAIDGADPELNPALTPTADPDLQGGERLDLALGLQLYSSAGALAGNRLELEVGAPLYESLDGPQMSVEYWATLGWSFTF